MHFQKLNVFFAQILNSAVTVMNTAGLWLSLYYRHLKGYDRKIPINFFGNVPANHSAGIQIQNNRQINKPISDSDVSLDLPRFSGHKTVA